MMRLVPGLPCPKPGCSGTLLVGMPATEVGVGPGLLFCSKHPMPSPTERLYLAREDRPLSEVHSFYWRGHGVPEGFA
jgi:hypothetical protein